MSLKQLISKSMRDMTPAIWQQLKYRQYLTRGRGERDIHVVHRFIDPTRAALDVGVHLGMYTRHLSRYANTVTGFEANPDSAEFARRSLRGVATIICVALSSKTGTACLRVPNGGADGAESALGTLSKVNALGGHSYQEMLVQARRLDEFSLPTVGFIKIDVEGHEEDVLDGGRELLERDRPTYMIEIEERHNPGSFCRITDLFRSADYDALFYDAMALRPATEFSPQTHQNSGCADYVNNFFFVPREFKSRIAR